MELWKEYLMGTMQYFSTSNKTYIVQADRITAMWYRRQIVAAWDADTGYAANLWNAYVLTRNAALAQDPPKRKSP